MLMTLGTGIGGGIIIGGELHRGRSGSARVRSHPGRARRSAVRLRERGCWEQYAAVCPGRRARECRQAHTGRRHRLLGLGGGTPDGITGPSDVTQAAPEGDPIALALLPPCGGWLGQGLADLAAVLDPACFVSAAVSPRRGT